MTAPSAPAVAPVLSTPETRIFEDPTEPIEPASVGRIPDAQLAAVYEVERTVREIRAGRWKRVALQFPDGMLVDAPRVYEGLRRGLAAARARAEKDGGDEVARRLDGVRLEEVETDKSAQEADEEEQLYILGDTSYGACCVDEIAAEHVDADVVVHYGRSCLSPTARLPVIYVFTTRPLELDPVVACFEQTYPDKQQKIVLMADIPYSGYLAELHGRLRENGYAHVFLTDIVHDPSAPLPNRTMPPEVKDDAQALREYQLFHISDPPTALLLTLSSRVAAIHIYPTTGEISTRPQALLATSAQTLRRRYALLTRLSTVPVFGILINTLSVKNYLHVVEHVKRIIAEADKKSYTFVVGKINAAKVANFSEVGGWVVIGCWESSLIESKEFWRPIITPFELQLALKSDEERIWTGEWTGDFEAVLKEGGDKEDGGAQAAEVDDENGNSSSEEESAPPEFDLRTGRYVSHARPMRTTATAGHGGRRNDATAINASAQLIKRANGDVAQIGGVASPGAEFLRSQRTWQGLGSDFDQDDESGRRGAVMEEGRSGIARGYTHGVGVGDGDAAAREVR
ncbi:putative diphthamide synthesis protein-domain-containing protein [Phyllosticta citribraziliensis]|uniref:2-(3-amino-3-carboxypropyl)histidine synthase subunit 2 n=1 Tax=Phyllosticta citribraziliensis TaxID=989973 RepID=A0ABR1LHY6_9PEZI